MQKSGLIRFVGYLFLIIGCATLESGGQFTAGRQALMRGDNATALAFFEQVASQNPNYVAPFTSFRESIWTYLGRAQYQSGKLVEAKGSLERAVSQLPDDWMAKLYLALTNIRLQTSEKVINDPLSLEDISFALRERVEPKRVAALARERGVAFDLTANSESQLRKAGADDFLIGQIKEVRAQALKQKKTTEGQLGEQAKALTVAFIGVRDQLDFLSKSRTGIFWDPNREIRSQIQSGLSLLQAARPDWPKVLSIGEQIGQDLEEEIDLVRRQESEELRRQERR